MPNKGVPFCVALMHHILTAPELDGLLLNVIVWRLLRLGGGGTSENRCGWPGDALVPVPPYNPRLQREAACVRPGKGRSN